MADAAAEDVATRGWTRLALAPDVARWSAAALPLARAAVRAPEHEHWHQCEGTWFVGVDVLPNDGDGAVAGVAFPESLSHVIAAMGVQAGPMHPAQVSVIYPGYPKPRTGESEGAFRYRLKRDAAHVDGLLPVGPERQRMLKEPHAYVLGIPLTTSDEEASPMVIWEGSHHVMRARLGAVLAAHAPEDWPHVDLTETYQTARRDVFETCPRVALHASPGEAYLMHRLALHGVAPWGAEAKAGPDGRMIAYFRPELAGPVTDWLEAP